MVPFQMLLMVGHPLSLCVNSGLDGAQSLAIASHPSCFCCEVDHAAANRALPMHPVYVYKLADGLDRPVAATASGGDWAYVAAANCRAWSTCGSPLPTLFLQSERES